MSQPIPVDILSDDDDAVVGGGASFERSNIQNDAVVVVDISTPLPTKPSKKKQRIDFNSNPTTVFIIDDDPTPRKPSTGPTTSTSFVAETPLSDASIVKCSKGSFSLSLTPSMIEDTPISELSKSEVAAVKFSIESPGEGTPSFVADTPMSDLSKHKAPVVTSDKSISDSQQLLRPVLDPKFSGDQTPSFVDDTPMSDVSKHEVPIVNYNRYITDSQPLSHSVSDPKFSGIRGLICLESDNESEDGSGIEASKQIETSFTFDAAKEMEWSSRFSESAFSSGNLNMLQTAKNSSLSNSTDCDTSLAHGHLHSETERLEQTSRISGEKTKNKDKDNTDKKKNNNTDEAIGRKRISKEDKIRLQEEKKQQKEQEKLRKASEKAEAAEMKKLQQEKLKWEKGKFALKSIVAEMDTRVVEVGSVGGHLLTRFAEKGVSYRITSNPIERSIVWTMTVPDHIAQISSEETEVRYVLLVYEAEEFCNIIMNESLMDHVSQVQRRYPYHTICYLTNRLMAYINKKEQEHYKNPSNCIGWRRPPIEEALSKLTTHFTRVHTRQCIDEAELAEHVVGLTCSLASCQFRKKLTRLSVNANGSNVSKDSVDRNLIKKNVWLKALVAIPKVQPRFAIAIWKKYPTMKSLLSVYMDPSKSVHEKEFLLKDLITEGLLGGDRRLGEVCSKRIYRILMAQSGNIITEDVENGADFFSHQPS